MTVQWQARPTTYKGIRMRSRLEARVAAHLDLTSADPWVYEPRAFASERGQYLPDFELPTVPGGYPHPIYVEAKPTVEDAYLVMPRMQIIWDSAPDATLMIVVSAGICFYAFGGGTRRWHVDQWVWAS